ncbi:hypothetical protein Lal_00006061 [Lupinus albus]|nr:hypothetical protein Lal_00006061 [Lupinus albus]
MVQVSLAHQACGMDEQQPVIPPLSRARGVRCSVKPASRFALLSRRHDTYAFAQVPYLNSQLGVGKPTFVEPNPPRIGAARTQAPTTTNYDVGSTTWVDLRRAPLLSAMEIYIILFVWIQSSLSIPTPSSPPKS